MLTQANICLLLFLLLLLLFFVSFYSSYEILMADVLENSKEKKLTLFFGSLLLPQAPRQHSRGFSKWVRLIGSYQPYSDREGAGVGGGRGVSRTTKPKTFKLN